MHYFVSDIHLGSGDVATQRRVERDFLNFLKQVEQDGESLFLVGDIFDFWFEYKRAVPKGFVRVLGRLAELSDKGVRVVMLTGNHDMWVGNYLTEECGVELYTTPQTFTVAGKQLFVAHGDNLNTKGKPVLRVMNALFRSKGLRKTVSWLVHPDLFLRFGQWWSGKSRKSHSGIVDARVLNPLVAFATEYAKHNAIDYFIFGHLHYMAEIFSPHALFMGDWHREPNYVTLDDNGKIELKYYN